MQKTLAITLCSAVLVAVLAVSLIFFYPTTAPEREDPPSMANVHKAVNKALVFINTYHPQSLPDYYCLLMMDVVHRRFNQSDFQDALTHYDQILAQNQDSDYAVGLRLFRRIAVHDNPFDLSDLNYVSNDLDFLTVRALYYDQLSSMYDYDSLLSIARDEGGYLLTHALLSSIWIKDNGGELPACTESIYVETAKLLKGTPPVTDLQIEAAAFLYVAGQQDLVSNVFLNDVISAQNADGGWSEVPVENFSSLHATILALMLLLHLEFPAETYPSMLA